MATPNDFRKWRRRSSKSKASVIVVFTDAAAHAAQHATLTIPIIVIARDFVADGLGASLAKPGSNITGISMLAPELETKQLEILKEMQPAARRFGVLSSNSTVSPTQLQARAC